MVTNVRFLLLENNEDDANFIVQIIGECEQQYTIVRCTSLEKGLSLITESQFDIFVWDFGMISPPMISMLEQVVELDDTLPIIILSNFNDSSVAINVLNLGAQDFLVKEGLTSEILERSINFAISRKESEKTHILSEMVGGKLAQHASDAIFTITEQGTVLYVNPASELLLGERKASLLGISLLSKFDKPTAKQLKDIIKKVSLSVEPCRKSNLSEGLIYNARGESISVEYSLGNWCIESGHVYSLFVRDISKRKNDEKQVKNLLEVQKALAHIQAQRGYGTSLSDKLYNALLAILTISWIRCETSNGAIIYIQKNDKSPLIVEIQMEILEQEYEVAKQHTASDNHLNFFYDHDKERYWFLLKAKNGHKLGYIVLPYQPRLLATPEFSYQFQLLLNTIASMIEEYCATARIAQLSHAIEQSPAGVLITDDSGDIQYVNQAVLDMTGYKYSEVIGKNTRLFKSGRMSAQFYMDLWNTIKSGNTWKGEIQNCKKQGEVYWESMLIAPVEGLYEDEPLFIAIKEDIEQRKRNEQQLLYMATHDVLTGIPNRSSLLEYLTKALNSAQQTQEGVAVLLLDLDQFSLVNEQLGHLLGDDLLKVTAERLRKNLRKVDRVGRQGADEFIVVLPSISTEQDVQYFVDSILKLISKPYQLGDYTIQVSCSVGIAICLDGCTSSEALYRQAGAAMYQAKKMGGNSGCFFTEDMDLRLHSRIWFQKAIQEAFQTKQLFLYYQPQVNTKTGFLSGAEALLRWKHPEKGFIPPGEFIPLAEETGAIVEIGHWIINEVCQQLKEWKDKGLQPPRVAINLSAHQLMHIKLADDIIKCLKRYGLKPKMLEVELTESEMMQSPERAIKILSELSSHGIHISGDDFGTGYSSLSYLKRLPLDCLKIDRSFITDITKDQNSHAIASMIISLGHSLGLSVLAEGVEYAEQLKLLTRLGCDEFQGFYCSPAIPADEFASLIKSSNRLIEVDNEMNEKRVLLLLDDEVHILKALYRLFRKNGYLVLRTDEPEQAFKYLAEYEVGVILCDQRMPTISGTEFFSQVKGMYPNTVRMILSGYTELRSIIDAVNQGFIYKFLTKPWDDNLLRKHVEEAFQFYEMKRDRG